jgi:hypothetical protein
VSGERGARRGDVWHGPLAAPRAPQWAGPRLLPTARNPGSQHGLTRPPLPPLLPPHSPGYSFEITTYLGGWGLEGLLGSRKPVLSGIVNGIDDEE